MTLAQRITTNLAQVITSKPPKLGPDDHSTAYMFIIYIYIHTLSLLEREREKKERERDIEREREIKKERERERQTDRESVGVFLDFQSFALTKIRCGKSTVGGPKWTKIDLFRPKWTKIRFGIRSFWSSTLFDSIVATPDKLTVQNLDV